MKPTILQLLANLAAVPESGDAHLLKRFVSERDEAAFTAILERHGRLVWSVCRSSLPNEADAEDAFQATFIALFRGAVKIRQQESLAPWLHRTATRIAQKIRLSAARRQHREQRAAQPEAAMVIADGTWETLQFAVHDEIAQLPKLLRTAFVLCVLEGRRQEDAANELGVPAGTIAARVSRAKKQMLERLNQRGLAPLFVGAVSVAVPETLSALVCKQLANGFAATSQEVLTLAKLGGVTMKTKSMVGGAFTLVFVLGGALLAEGQTAPFQVIPPTKQPDLTIHVPTVFEPIIKETPSFPLIVPDRVTKLIETMEGFRKEIPPAQGLSEQNGLSVKETEPYLLTHLGGVAKRLEVKTRGECLVLMTYLKDRDAKLRYIAIQAIEGVVKAYPSGMSIEVLTDLRSESHRKMILRFVELIDNLPASTAKLDIPPAAKVEDYEGLVKEALEVDLPLVEKADSVFIEECSKEALGRELMVTKAADILELRQCLKVVAAEDKFGPPVLSKIPYINRLFKKVGPGSGVRFAELTFYRDNKVLRKIWVNENGEWGFKRPGMALTNGVDATMVRLIEKHWKSIPKK